MKRAPETGDILTRKTMIEILISGIVMAIGTICLFSYELNNNAGISKAMTMAFTLFVMYQLFNAYNRKANSNKTSKYLYIAILISFILQVLIIYIPQLQIIFRTTSIDIFDWALIILISFTIIITEKVMKKVIK